jgi:hypothetical protein
MTPAQKTAAATSALKDVETKRPGLGQQFVHDFINAGFRRDISVTADLMAIRTISVADYNAVTTFINDPTAVADAAKAGFQGLAGGAVANTVPGAAQNVANAATAAPGAAFTGLSNAVSANPISGIVAFLGNLTSPTFWLRIAEVVIGAAMVIVGIGKMTGMGDDLKSITSKAKKVALA